MKKILAQVEPERIVRGICEVFEVEKEALLKKGYKGVARSVLMEMLYRYGGMNQREIGELMGIDYSSVSITRKRLLGAREKDRKLLAKIERLSQRLARSQG
jgi:chromosomal replication initiation ATPase DnaA